MTGFCSCDTFAAAFAAGACAGLTMSLGARLTDRLGCLRCWRAELSEPAGCLCLAVKGSVLLGWHAEASELRVGLVELAGQLGCLRSCFAQTTSGKATDCLVDVTGQLGSLRSCLLETSMLQVELVAGTFWLASGTSPTPRERAARRRLARRRVDEIAWRASVAGSFWLIKTPGGEMSVDGDPSWHGEATAPKSMTAAKGRALASFSSVGMKRF